MSIVGTGGPSSSDTIRVARLCRANQHFTRLVVNQDGDDCFPSCRDGAQASGNLIVLAALVEHGIQRGNGRFDRGQPPRGRLMPA